MFRLCMQVPDVDVLEILFEVLPVKQNVNASNANNLWLAYTLFVSNVDHKHAD